MSFAHLPDQKYDVFALIMGQLAVFNIACNWALEQFIKPAGDRLTTLMYGKNLGKSAFGLRIPLLSVSYLVRIAVVRTSSALGASPCVAKRLGAGTALISSIALGMWCHGHVGALMGFGVWLLPEFFFCPNA